MNKESKLPELLKWETYGIPRFVSEARGGYSLWFNKTEKYNDKVIKQSIWCTEDESGSILSEKYDKVFEYFENIRPHYTELDYMMLCSFKMKGVVSQSRNYMIEKGLKVSSFVIENRIDQFKVVLDKKLNVYLFEYCYNWVEGKTLPEPSRDKLGLQFQEEMYFKTIECAKRNFPYWQEDGGKNNFIDIKGDYEFLDFEEISRFENIEDHYNSFHSRNDIVDWLKNSKFKKSMCTLDKWKKIFNNKEDIRS